MAALAATTTTRARSTWVSPRASDDWLTMRDRPVSSLAGDGAGKTATRCMLVRSANRAASPPAPPAASLAHSCGCPPRPGSIAGPWVQLFWRERGRPAGVDLQLLPRQGTLGIMNFGHALELAGTVDIGAVLHGHEPNQTSRVVGVIE